MLKATSLKTILEIIYMVISLKLLLEQYIWIEDITGTNAKRKILEAKQDLVTLDELDRTIGKHLEIT